MSKLDRAYNITTIKFEIVSVNAAFMKKGIVNTFGPDSVRFNITGTVEEVETSSTTVEGRVTVAKMMEIYQKGLPFSIKYKKDLPRFISTIEELIEILHYVKGRNTSLEGIFVPNTKVTLRELINFYMTLVNNNDELIRKLLTKDLEEQDTGLLILGNDVMKTSNIITGEKFVSRITEDANIVADGSFKNKIVKLRYGY